MAATVQAALGHGFKTVPRGSTNVHSIAAVYARKSTEQNGVAGEQTVGRAFGQGSKRSQAIRCVKAPGKFAQMRTVAEVDREIANLKKEASARGIRLTSNQRGVDGKTRMMRELYMALVRERQQIVRSRPRPK